MSLFSKEKIKLEAFKRIWFHPALLAENMVSHEAG